MFLNRLSRSDVRSRSISKKLQDVIDGELSGLTSITRDRYSSR